MGSRVVDSDRRYIKRTFATTTANNFVLVEVILFKNIPI